jgi:hypothetical protein
MQKVVARKMQGDRHNEIGAPENGMIARRQF